MDESPMCWRVNRLLWTKYGWTITHAPIEKWIYTRQHAYVDEMIHGIKKNVSTQNKGVDESPPTDRKVNIFNASKSGWNPEAPLRSRPLGLAEFLFCSAFYHGVKSCSLLFKRKKVDEITLWHKSESTGNMDELCISMNQVLIQVWI